MTNRGFFETIGVRAVFEDLSGFLAANKQAKAATDQLAKAQERLERVSIISARQQRTAVKSVADALRDQATATAASNDAVNRAQAALGTTNTRVSQQIEAAQTRVITARQKVADSAALSTKKQITAADQLAKAEKALETVQVNGAARVLAAQTAVNVAIRKRVEQQSKSAASVLTAQTGAPETAALAAAGLAQAQGAVVAAGGRLTKTMTATSVATSIFSGVARTASAATRHLGEALIAVTGFSNRFAVALRFGALAIGAFTTAAAIGSAAKFQDTLTKIDTLTSSTTEETKALGKEILNMTKSFPQSADQLGAGAYIILSSGIKDVAAAQKILENSAMASAIGLGEIKDIAKIVTAAINSYGQENITASQATDILVASVKAGSAEASDFVSSIGPLLAIAPLLGVKFDELGASIAFLTNAGFTAAQAGTAMRNVLQEIFDPSKEAEEALASVGTSFAEVRKSIREDGLTVALDDLIEKLGRNHEALQVLFPDMRGLAGAAVLLRKEGKGLADTLLEVNTAGGITRQGFDRLKENFSFQAALLKNTLNRSLIELGTAILPTVTRGIQSLNEWINRNREGIARFGKAVAEAANFLVKNFGGGLLQIINTVSSVVGVLSKIIGVLSSINKEITSIVHFSPAAIAAIAALGSAFVWALPGGQVIKGLFLIITALGIIESKGQGVADAINKALGLKTSDALKGEITASLKGVDNQNLSAVKDALKGAGVPSFAINDMATQIVEQADEAKDALDKTAREAEELAKIVLPDLTASYADNATGAGKVDEELKQLSQTFAESSKAAGAVQDLTEQLGLFGIVSQELAKKMGLTATQAGNIQGADAVAAAEARATAQAFNFARALGTVAQAFQQSAQVAQQIVLGLARTALSASQAALSAVLSRPTQQQAALGVGLAQQNLANAQTAARINPQIAALNSQLSSINAQMKGLQAAAKAQKAAYDRQIDIARQQLDQMRLADLRAQIAYERQQAALEKLIDATRKQASELQETFLRNNEDLQRQINESIGSGDRAGALALVDQQRTAAKAYQTQAAALVKNEQQLTSQQKALRLEEEERQRVQRLIQAEAEARIAAIEALANNTSAIDAQIEALETQSQAIQDQIASLEAQKAAGDAAAQAIQDQLAVLQAQTALLEAQAIAADKTLLTQEEQIAKAQELIAMIAETSAAVRTLATATGEELVPEVQAARDAFLLMRGMMQVLTDAGYRAAQIFTGFDPAAARVTILGNASEKTAGQIGQLGGAVSNAVNAINNAAAQAQAAIANSTTAAFNNTKLQAPGGNNPGFSTSPFNPGITPFMFPKSLIPQNAVGGIYNKPTIVSVGETNELEAIVPIERPREAQEIFRRIPPALLANLLPTQRGNIFAPNISVNGESLDTMRAMVHREVDRAFSRAISSSHRRGSLLSQGLGPAS